MTKLRVGDRLIDPEKGPGRVFRIDKFWEIVFVEFDEPYAFIGSEQPAHRFAMDQGSAEKLERIDGNPEAV